MTEAQLSRIPATQQFHTAAINGLAERICHMEDRIAMLADVVTRSNQELQQQMYHLQQLQQQQMHQQMYQPQQQRHRPRG